MSGLMQPGPTLYEAEERRKKRGSQGLLEAVGEPLSYAPGVTGLLGNALLGARMLTGEQPVDEGLSALSMMTGLLQGTKVAPIMRGATWYKGMYPRDYTKEGEPLIDPKDIRRPSDFPTFNSADNNKWLKGIRGFFSSDPAVASKFATPPVNRSGAVFPVEINAKRKLVIDAKGRNAGDIQFGPSGRKFQDAVRSGKYDMVLIKNTADEGDVAVALSGSNIKSVFEK